MTEAAELIRAVASLAWPVAVIVALVVLRAQLRALLTGGASRVKAGPFSVEWDHQVSRVETDLEQPDVPTTPPGAHAGPVSDALASIVETAPGAAVLQAFGRIEQALRELLVDAKTPEALLRTGGAGLARAALKRGLITEETARAVEGLSVLRNLTAHGERVEDVSPGRARDFLALTDAVLFALGHRPA